MAETIRMDAFSNLIKSECSKYRYTCIILKVIATIIRMLDIKENTSGHHNKAIQIVLEGTIVERDSNSTTPFYQTKLHESENLNREKKVKKE